MIKKIEIERFRGIDHFVMEDLTPFTMLAGKNNVGKSSFLEAIFLFYDHFAPDVFAKLSNLRGGFIEPNMSLWAPLFYQMDMGQELQIKIEYQDEKSAALQFKRDMDFAITSSQNMDPVLTNLMINGINTDQILRFTYEHEGYKEYGFFSAADNSIMVNMNTSLQANAREKLPWTLYINPFTVRRPQDVTEWIGRLEIEGSKNEAVDLLRLINPDIRDVFTASQNGQTQIYIKGSQGVLPLKYAGDGIIRLLYMMAAIMSNPNSVILVDEIENGVHYSMYKKLLASLARVAEEKNCQIIATTHSYEILSDGIRGVSDEGLGDSFSLHRLERSNEGLMDYCFDSEMLNVAINSYMEVR